MFETIHDRCPVKMFRTYLAKRPADLRISGPFYLAVIYGTEAGLAPFDSGNEKQQQAICNAIDNCSIKPFSHRQYFIPLNDPRILYLTFSFFQQADFQQNILPLHAPINMYKCNVKVYQNPPTMSTAPVEKNHEPLKKRRRVIYCSESSQEIK